MKAAPPTIDGARVLLVADLGDTSVTGNTRHVVEGAEVEDFAALAIVQYDGDEGVYLLYCDGGWGAVTDTYHDSVEAAVAQAEFEFEPVEFRPPT
jgi:hypothetical protein